MSFRAIGDELHMNEDRVAKGLREDSLIPAELVRKTDRPEWTEERLRVAAYLRSQGHTYQQIAAVFGYRTGQTIRYALTVHGPDLGIDPVTGHTIPAGETAPDPTRWAPRLSPWDGAPRTGEDPAVVRERLSRDRRQDGPDTRSHDVQWDVLGRMKKRDQAIADDPASIPSDDTDPARTDDSTTRQR